jgi:pimeloyl-ACP methyl ester carboxylesterase/quercetin dioxygenase-like cupin family protein
VTDPLFPAAYTDAAGEPFWFLGGQTRVLVPGSTTKGALSIMEFADTAGQVPPHHTHEDEEEIWIVLDGKISFFVGDKLFDLKPGEVAYGPRGVAHSYLVRSETAWMATVFAPALIEEWFTSNGTPVSSIDEAPASFDVGAIIASAGPRRSNSGLNATPARSPTPLSSGSSQTESKGSVMFERSSAQTGKHRWTDKRVLIPAALAVAVLVVPAVSPASSAPAPVPAAAPAQHGPKPTVVLVHGAFADSSSWSGVIARLQHDGYPVIAAANPLRALDNDTAYVSSLLTAIPGPVILVGHSYGGEVITNAAVGHANVKALVYMAAYAPDQGETAQALTTKFPGSQLGKALVVRPYAVTGGGGEDGYVDPAKFHDVFAADVPAATTDLMAAEQRPVSLAALQAPSGVPAWKTIPSWSLVAGADQAIPAAAEQFMAKRAGAHTVEIKDSSHVVMISHPDKAEDLIKQAAKATG